MKVEVRPVNTEKWHGKSGKEDLSRPKTIQALVDAKTMRYATGLSEEDLKALQEKKFKSDLSDLYDPEKPHSFWDSKAGQVKLEANTMIFDTDNPYEFIRYRIMQASRFVANSLQEWKEGKYPDATHVIYNEAEEVKVKASKIAITSSARKKINGLALTKKKNLIMYITQDNYKLKSEDDVVVKLEELIEKDASIVVNALEVTPEILAAQAIVFEALQKSILVKKGHKVYYMDGSIGESVEEAAKYLLAEDNNSLMIRIQSEIANK